MNDTAHFDVLTGELKGSQLSKARKFNKLKCVVPRGDGQYLVKHIEGYNKTDYQVNAYFDECDCQYYVKNKKSCSHVLAVALFKKQQEEHNGASDSFYE